ncbi:MAG: hypothetical protein KGP34_07370 [Bacteroidetes bacterium]|nr:hypothetical protein [Bacteroidota bacterium]
MENISAIKGGNPDVIMWLIFGLHGKIGSHISDGREYIVPIRHFPELQKLSLSKRKKYTIVDDHTILLEFADSVYHIEDFVGNEAKWKKR